jgi:hypothetical protein
MRESRNGSRRRGGPRPRHGEALTFICGLAGVPISICRETERALTRFSGMPSTVIRSFDYDPASRALDVTFVSGRRYRYADVPDEIAQAFAHARSKGGFFNTKIRDAYRYVELDETEGEPVPEEALWPL